MLFLQRTISACLSRPSLVLESEKGQEEGLSKIPQRKNEILYREKILVHKLLDLGPPHPLLRQSCASPCAHGLCHCPVTALTQSFTRSTQKDLKRSRITTKHSQSVQHNRQLQSAHIVVSDIKPLCHATANPFWRSISTDIQMCISCDPISLSRNSHPPVSSCATASTRSDPPNRRHETLCEAETRGQQHGRPL